MSKLSFPNIFNISSGKVNIVNGDIANRQAMKCILLSNIGELLGDPLFGSDIKSCIFELKNDFIRQLFKDKTTEAFSRYIKNVIVNSNDINIEFDEDGVVVICINYRDRNSPEPNILQLEVLANGAVFMS